MNPFRVAAEDPELAKHRITEAEETKRAAIKAREETKRAAINTRDTTGYMALRIGGLIVLCIAIIAGSVGFITNLEHRTPKGCVDGMYDIGGAWSNVCAFPEQIGHIERVGEHDLLVCTCPGHAKEVKP